MPRWEYTCNSLCINKKHLRADASVGMDDSSPHCWNHNTCSSIAKTYADALSNYCVSRQTEQQGSCLCNYPQEINSTYGADASVVVQ